jgi:glutamate synthase domain-containing protein 3
MAGGLLIVLGLDRRRGEPLVGEWCATGMHGGALYLRGEIEEWRVASQFVGLRPAEEPDLADIRPHIAAFCQTFDLDESAVMQGQFVKIAPVSHRPYSAKYAA